MSFCVKRAVHCLALVAAAGLAGSLHAGVVAHWTFDAPDATGAYPDSEGNGHPAAPAGSTGVSPYTGKAPFGKAVAFAGETDSYLTLPPITNIQTSSFTVAAWVNMSDAARDKSNFGYNFILADWKSSPEGGFNFGTNPIASRFDAVRPVANMVSRETTAPARGGRGGRAGGGGGGGNANRKSIVREPSGGNWAVGLNEWHHLAWTWDRATTTLSCYLDGELLWDQKKQSGDQWSSTLDVAVNSHPMRIGSQEGPVSGTVTSTPFNGAMDELWVFDEALAPIPVRNLVKFNNVRGQTTPVANTVTNPTPTPPPNVTSAARPPVAVAVVPEVRTPPAPPPDVGVPSSARPTVAVTPPRTGLSPGQIVGVIACLTIIVGMSCYLTWAFIERGKLHAAGKL